MKAIAITASILLSLLAAPDMRRVRGESTGPPLPTSYQVTIRYRILAARNQRLAQFAAMTHYFDSLGFKKHEGAEDEAENSEETRMTGTIPASQAGKLLADPHVRAILLMPAGFKPPAESEARSKIQLLLAGGFPIEGQRLLADQVIALLEPRGFREAIGYDNREHARILGTVPSARIDDLLEDPRWQGEGWLVPLVPAASLPSPVRSNWPVRIVEVLPEPAGVAPAHVLLPQPRLPEGERYLAKVARELRDLEGKEELTRVEVVLSATPPDDDPRWKSELLAAAPDALIEGRIGELVTLRSRPASAIALARLPVVASVRLPRPAEVRLWSSAASTSAEEVRKATGLDRLQTLDRRGRGIRLAIIDTDFRGAERMLGKALPAGTRLVDLTAATRPELEPEKVVHPAQPIGHGTRCAQAAAWAAPEANITLIRVGADSPYMLEIVARFINGEVFRWECLNQRLDELAHSALQLQNRRDALLEERKAILDNFSQDKATLDRRADYFKRQADHDQQELLLRAREERYFKLVRDLKALKGIRIVANSLVWNEGYPLGGNSALSRYFDERAFGGSFWFQAAGATARQAWTGLFRDVDGNGVMEFAAPEASLPSGRWTRELNYLGWSSFTGSSSDQLSSGRIRLSVQWREPHDPGFWDPIRDPYRESLARLRLLVLRQRDPSGRLLPPDEMEPVAQSNGWPQLLNRQPGYATYEQTVEFSVDKPGRYAVRIEGQVPPTIRPLNEPMLSGFQTRWELRPRLFVAAADDGDNPAGRPVFIDYWTEHGALGMPADARSIITIGAASPSQRAEPYSVGPPPPRQPLYFKPDFFAFDRLGFSSGSETGTGVAASFAAGTAAAAIAAGIQPSTLFQDLPYRPGQMLRIR